MLICLDGSLWHAGSTGDSAYWNGLLRELPELLSPNERLAIVTNGPSPVGPRPGVVELPRISSRLHSLIRWPLWARTHGARVAHTQYFLSPIIGAGRTAGITTVHDISFVIGPQWFRPRDGWLLTHGVRSSIRRARAIVTVSATSRSEICAWLPESCAKVHAIPNALGHDFLSVEPSASASIKGDYVLTVGTRWPRKNQRLAVDAVREYRKLTGDDLRLVITGKAGWGEESEEDWIVRPGYVGLEELKGLYFHAKALLFPSHHEGFGIPVLEAWACGTPIICSRGGALPEVVGNAGWCVPSQELHSWVQALQEIRQDSGKVASMVQLGQERLASFSWRRSAEMHLDLYRQCSL